MFVKQIVYVDNNRKANAPHYWLFVRGIHQDTGGFPSQRASTMENISMPWLLQETPYLSLKGD